MLKKGEGLSLQVIVVAALLLIVLIVLIAIFGGRSRLFVEGIEDCKAKGGYVRESNEPSGISTVKICDHEGETSIPMKNNRYCCIPIIVEKK